MSITIGQPQTVTVSDMQGPCPDGFHVPSNSEWTSMISSMRSMNAISSDSYSGLYQYLLLCGNGERKQDNGSIVTTSESAYWTSTAKDSGAAAYSYRFSSSYYYEMGYYTNMGLSVRPFKDTPVEPDSTWTRTYSSWNGGSIWRNTDLGLISLTSNGTTWITISDKNAGATQPMEYQSGKTAEKIGGYYQWGNNYMFPYSGNITTTSTRVNASNYGPSNPYSSSNFILGSSGNYGWDTSYNKNLWGGASGGTHIKTIEKKIKNICVWINVPDYTVRWKHYNGSILETDRAVMEGTTPTYNGATPTRSGYSFTGWSPTPAPIYEDTDYIAQFIEMITTKGVYYNSSLGLISVSGNGSTWYTMADKNLGATTVYNSGSLTAANCGKLYQWGNNYGFPYQNATSKTTASVNATGYGPGNYYSNSTFRYGADYWDNGYNANLWGGTTGTVEAMQGPCASGYHIPSVTEWRNLVTAWTQATGWTTDARSYFLSHFKLPAAGCLYTYSSGSLDQNGWGWYWSSTQYNATNGYLCCIRNNMVVKDDYNGKANGYSIRPFKNTPVQPDITRTKIA